MDYGFDRSDSSGYDTQPQCLYPSPTITAMAFTGDPRIAAFVAGCSTSKLKELYYPFALSKNSNLVHGHTLNVEWAATPTLTIRSITGYRIVDTCNEYNYGAYAGARTSARGSPLLMTIRTTAPAVPESVQRRVASVCRTTAPCHRSSSSSATSATLNYTAGV